MIDKRLQLRLLREFQDLDQEIADREASAAEIPKAVQSIEARVDAARAEQAGLEERRKGLERERMRRETDVEAERERLRSAQAKQLDVKTNKEYSALLREIEGINGKIDQLETQILEMMESAEATAAEIRQGAGRLREEEAEAESRKNEKKEELRRLESRLSELREEHKRLSVEIDPDWRAEYGRIKEARGWAVAGLNGNSCSGCHQSVMPQLIHEIKHGDEIKTCLHCNRIFYIPEETQKTAGTANPAEPTQA